MAGSVAVTIIAAADGSALGNPGPAGWAWYVDENCWASGGWPHGTNNMGELMAVLDLLNQTAHTGEDLLVHCDSKYVIDTVTKWMAGWKRRGWKKADGKPVMNLEIIQAIDAAMTQAKGAGRTVTFNWVKGHSGHTLNEAADVRANAAAKAYQDGTEPVAGPGFDGAQAGPSGAEVQSAPSSRTPEPEPDLFSELEADSVDVRTPAEEVVELERSLLTDEVRGDRAAVAALLHERWQEIGASGRVWTRDEMLAQVGPVGPVRLEVVDVVEPGPDQVLLVWRGVDEDDTSVLRSSLWVRSRQGWQQLFHQGTPES